MSNRAKVIREATEKLFDEWSKRGQHLDFRDIEEMLGRAYDAGKVDTPDLDAARWRMFMVHFGNRRAGYVRARAFYPPMPKHFTPDECPTITISHGAEWRLDCRWTERTGSADTIPKFIDLMLASHREEDGKK